MVISSNETKPGTMVDIHCDNGYSFTQSMFNSMSQLTFTCLTGGKWNETVYPTCQVTYCGIPDPINNGFILNSTGSSVVGQKVTYACYDGFQTQTPGSLESTCEAGGMFTSGIVCQAKQCPELTLSANLMTNNTGTDFGDLVVFSCAPGYDLRGAKQVICNTGGTWSHPTPTCVAKQCPIPMFKDALTMATTAENLGTAVAFACNSGYVINGTTDTSKSLTCGTDQMFAGDVVCVDKDECELNTNSCDDITQMCVNIPGNFRCDCKPGFKPTGSTCADIVECDMNNGGCSHTCTNSMGSFSCECPSGFSLFTQDGTNRRNIQAPDTGLKEGDIYHINHTCVRNVCPHPGNLTNGLLLSLREYFFYNETVKYQCNIGYQLNGSSDLTCGPNQSWDQSVPTCERAQCTGVMLEGPALNQERATIKMGETEVEYGGKAIVECLLDDGSRVNKTQYCAYNSQNNTYDLQGDSTLCPVIECGPLLTIPGSTVPTVNSTIGSSFTFTCQPNFNRQGSANETVEDFEVVCMNTGRWRYGNLTCVGNSCSDPGTSANATQVTDGYGFGQSVSYTCSRSGYTPVPAEPLYCTINSNGQVDWNSTVPTCKDTTDPVFDNCPTELYLKKPLEEFTFSPPTATDNSGSVMVTASDDFTGRVTLLDDLNVTYTAIDGENNTVTCLVSFIVQAAPW
ncbi:sushi, von Willebrand factor type A, EGF and pentraxin domain-containing protein 1-like [Patella vulgata]|uniref:sushi, von Willebrand factor type A, EGF and pentraxin domain-containing protein 1-like n=1 Tax=Patella vulgata TaxID=6465 RepID=UPI0024A855AF|nr:sushi, von Willebrand factor type A, EGF and pentraxin domain-containing protein 1-like [Patella vulgata]